VIGTTISHFKIDKMLGSGGMGEVYRARDTRLGRDLALKLLPEAAPERLARFEREARAVAGLAHPNIVVLHAIEEHEGRYFLVLELVEGPDLTELVAPGGLPIARVLELGIPLADALASAHERGVVHRDLKPANVKLTREGRVKVLDFGLARMLEPDADIARTIEAPLSGEGQVMGTVPYMALLARLGRIDEALSEADRERDDSNRTYVRALGLSLGGRGVEAEHELALLIRDHADDSAAQIASIYGALGETDSAFSWLDRGWDARDPGLLEIRFSRELDSLHVDPRWAELLCRVGLQS